MTENATIRTVEHGEASRLPEPQWFWRRWLIYGVTIWAMIILTLTVHQVLMLAERTVPPGQLAVLGMLGLIIRYSFYTAWSALILYGVGATVTDVTGFVAAFKTTRKETFTTAPPPATITPERVEAGQPEAQPDIPDTPSWERGR